jgi:hypothetical protein
VVGVAADRSPHTEREGYGLTTASWRAAPACEAASGAARQPTVTVKVSETGLKPGRLAVTVTVAVPVWPVA